MINFKEKALIFLNINEEELPFYMKDYTFDDLESPNNFSNIDVAASRILEAIKNEEKIMIYGDYDCDGISATSILVKMFQYLNYKVGYYIPSRYIDGYGINIERANQIFQKGYDLVITVDNGVAQHEAINFLTSKKIDVILTDHHEISIGVPECYCVVHPSMKKSNEELKECGAYVAFMLSCKVLGRIDEYLLSLAALATISDMMPLRAYNRVITKLALNIINKHDEFPYKLLLKNNNYIDEETLGFNICPKINAVGRIKEDMSVNDVVRFFVSDDSYIKSKILHEIEVVNSYRREILSNEINKIDFNSFDNKKIIILKINDISEGIIGLIAARILNECQKPVIVFTNAKDGTLKGSARSLKGISIVELFSYCQDLLEAYGGHQEAGGLSLKEEKFNEFVLKAEEYVFDKDVLIEDEECIVIEKDDVNYDNYLFLKKLSPFGIDYKSPRFELKLHKDDISFIGNNNAHIKGLLNNNASFIGFNLADKIIDDNIIAIGTIKYDTFKKGKNVTFNIEKIK